MPNAAQGRGQTRLAAVLEGKRKRRNIPARAHYGQCSRFAFTAGGALLQVNFAIDLRCFAHMYG